MVIGDGDIASVIKDRRGFTFFASGVSNSQETNEDEFQREIDLLMKQSTDSRLVYFSSLAIFTGKSRYLTHKRDMEYVVKQFPSHNIVRLGNITWGTNPNTLINYLKTHPEAPIRNEWRYVCSKDEFLYWVNLIPIWNCEINIPGRRMKVKDIVKEYVNGES